MHQGIKKSSWITVCMIAGLASLSFAQDPAKGLARGGQPGRGTSGFVSTLERRVGLSPEQRDAVRGLLAAQRQKSQSLREETDNKIRALLNSEQQKKFDEVLTEQKARFGRPKPKAS